jgi:ribosomal protein S18 acetylase RimI-like enzyme
MAPIRIVDVTDRPTFDLVPLCADPSFDHRTCDYWEDADRGSKSARVSWLEGQRPKASPAQPARTDVNPFLADLEATKAANPFAPDGGGGGGNPFAPAAGDDPDNPFAPKREARSTFDDDAPPKLRLLARGLGGVGSYAKVLLVDDVAVAYAQFGPLTAYPRAQRVRDLYPQLPESPLPAVITCIATTTEARHQGRALQLVDATCDDLAGRGFTAVEAYPQIGVPADATSAATPAFWERAGFTTAVADERFPVMRRELA